MKSGIHRLWLRLLVYTLSGVAARVSAQGIPEPDLIVYGVVLNVRSNANIRLGYGTLTWVFRPVSGGSPITVSTSLTNINGLFSYMLRVPCENPVGIYPPSSNTVQLTPGGILYNRAEVTWNGTNVPAFVQPSLTSTTISIADRGRIERVDLNVSASLIFENGMPVDWELTHFGRTGVDPLADPDGDGMNNLAEYQAGTNPNDGLSGLRFVEILPMADGIRLSWSSADFKSYSLQRSSNLSTGFFDITHLAATPPLNSFRDTNATGAGPYFYRLGLIP